MNAFGSYNSFSAFGAAASAPSSPTNPREGDFYLNQAAVSGGPLGWINTGTGGAWAPRPAGLIALDQAGTTYGPPPVAIASLPTCSSSNIGFAFINNGVASPTYNAAVGSTTGPAIDLVACTYNGSAYAWTYH